MVVRLVLGLDVLLARSRPAWAWVGELSLVTLGLHAAADHVDDLLAAQLAAIPAPWPHPETPLRAGTWSALVLEMLVLGWAFWSLSRTLGVEPVTRRTWKERLCVQALMAPLAWTAWAIAGCWVVGMAAEDLTSAWMPSLGSSVGALAGALVAWRFAWPSGRALLLRSPPAHSRLQGLLWAPAVVPMAVAAVRFGWPVWGLW